jgi:hypothetical protein
VSAGFGCRRHGLGLGIHLVGGGVGCGGGLAGGSGESVVCYVRRMRQPRGGVGWREGGGGMLMRNASVGSGRHGKDGEVRNGWVGDANRVGCELTACLCSSHPPR